MILKKIFEGSVTTHTPLGNIDLSGYKRYSVLLRLDNAKSDSEAFRFTTYNNSIQVYQNDFYTQNGWYIHNVIHEIYHPKVGFVIYNWNNEAKVRLWIYATCCTPEEVKRKRRVIRPRRVKLTEIGIIN